jgi:RNA polymerase sigma-70 factor (ECF subfamily)
MQTVNLSPNYLSLDHGLDRVFALVLASAFPASGAANSNAAADASLLALERQEIAAARGGDDDAFRRIVQRHQSTIATQMLRFSRDPTVVEELVHDVFVEAFVSLNAFRHRSPFEHWLRKIAVRVGYRLWRTQARDRHRRDAMLSEPTLQAALQTPCETASDATERLHQVLEMMSHRDRLVLTLLYWDDRSVAEAAELAGWTQTMVKVQAHRARKKLKRLLEEVNTEETNHDA